MITIHKYKLDPEGTKIEVPANYEILCVKVQYDEPVVWILLDVDKPKDKKIRIGAYPTGGKINYFPGKYIDTCLLMDGRLVFHFFVLEVTNDQ